MKTSVPEYHTFTPMAFYGDFTSGLERDAKIADSLIDTFRASLPPASISVLRSYGDLARAEVAQRHDRLERLDDDPLFIDGLRDRARALQAALPVHEYVASEWPGIILERRGRCLRGRCPFLGCRDETASLTIFQLDFAWCATCDRGGHIFRVIALCEGLGTPFEQVRRAAELVGDLEGAPDPASIPHGNRSFTTDSLKESVKCEQSRWGTTFQPIRIVDGKVVSS